MSDEADLADADFGSAANAAAAGANAGTASETAAVWGGGGAAARAASFCGMVEEVAVLVVAGGRTLARLAAGFPAGSGDGADDRSAPVSVAATGDCDAVAESDPAAADSASVACVAGPNLASDPDVAALVDPARASAAIASEVRTQPVSRSITSGVSSSLKETDCPAASSASFEL